MTGLPELTRKKDGVVHGGTHKEASLNSYDEEALIDQAVERRILMKLDLWIVTVMTLFYLLSFLDRSNIGNARVAGLQADLKLTDFQYQLAITFTYVPYVVAELPSNLLLKIVGPQILLPTIVTIWGVITLCQGFCHSLGALIACRVFLGFFEGCLLPGIMVYTATLAGAFGGLLAAAIQQMNGDKGIRGWSWIFIIEGTVTALIGIISYFTLPESPSAARFLTEQEKTVLLARLRAETRAVGYEEEHFDWSQVKRALLHTPQLWILGLGLFGNGMTLFVLAYFLPSIVGAFGYSSTKTQSMTVPPYAVAFVVTMTVSFFSDRYRARGPVIIGMSAVALIGFGLFFANLNVNVSYLGVFFAVTGVYCTASSFCTWIPNNSGPHYKRASLLAMSLILTNVGGIASTWLFPTSAAPRYRGGIIAHLVCASVPLICGAINVAFIHWGTKKKQEQREKILAPYEGDEKRAWRELGDNHPDFKWMF
ncbi:MFS general substrate transporter [Dacryopinax primogenitus]|uniref:MFS general substrate transporter n=1 Tax=Dacryopinax primogenitus (strain DJM 731) TaxID=1858805 RepID=M5FNU3_DACPD|nr:MFS general substrate transporter [Dacryopinax primogenitus]EJT96563.1 MFS general substrate transporter [Dacryopinax primogenitus]